MSSATLLSYFVDEKTTWLFVFAPNALEPIAFNTGVPPEHLRACVQRLLIDCNGRPAGYPDKQESQQRYLIEQALILPPRIGHLSRPEGRGPDSRKLSEPKYAFTYLDELSPKLLPASMHNLLQDCDVLCISAHGPLHGLPLHALRWNDSTYLAERFGVCYVSGMGMLRHCRDRNRARRTTPPYRPKTGLIACIDMFGGQSREFEKDCDLFASLGAGYGNKQTYQNLIGAKGLQAATKQRVMKESQDAQVIHLSCHGIFAGDYGWRDPLQSGLVLADGERSHLKSGDLQQRPQEFRDCLLTARDIYDLRLDADLVTLGACSTGRVQVESGDDLLGLSRAWLYAGTPSVLLSLWNVHTQSSHRLLQVFYQQWLIAGQPKWRALQVAQQTLLGNVDDQEFRHPYHWAPFILVGDWI